jgi:DNA-binding response OmpR family regulator
MPGGIGGRELARRARALRPQLPILLVTGYASEATPIDELPADVPTLRKPFDQAALAAALAALLGPEPGAAGRGRSVAGGHCRERSRTIPHYEHHHGASPAMTQSPIDPSQARIFVLEDDPEVARLICMSLAEYGFRCEQMRAGRQLLERARQYAPDLCIVDLGLPDMDGMQVVRELQDGSPCAVLILTGRNDVTDRVLGLELGADDYIVKPFEPRELVARVRSILRRYQRAASAGQRPANAVPRASPAGPSTPTATP